MRRFAVVVVWAAIGIVAACSTFSTTEGDSPDAATDSPGNEAGSPVPPPPPAADASDDAAYDGTVFYDDFENGTDCNTVLYVTFAATVAPTTEAHGGTQACRLCKAGPGRPQVSRDFVPRGAGRYQLHYWAHLSDGGTYAIATVVLDYPEGPPDAGQYQGSAVTLTPDEWTDVSMGGDAPEGGATSGKAILLGDSDAGDGACFIFDDVRLVFTPQ